MTLASQVRLATPADEEGVLAMLRLMHRESGLRDAGGQPFPLCEEMMLAAARQGLGNCGIIGEPGDLVEGSISLGVSTTWYSPKEYLGDYWNYVRPDFRNSNHARALIAWAKGRAAASGMPLLLGILSPERTAAKDRLLEQTMGATRYGSTFLYHPPGGAP